MKRPAPVFIVLAAILGAVLYKRCVAPKKIAVAEQAAASKDEAPRGGPSTVELVGVHTADEPQGLGSFSGHVTSDGAGVASAELTFARGDAVATALTDASGAFTFRPSAAGSYELVGISAKGFLPYVAHEDAVRLEARPGRVVSGLLFQLVAESAIRVHVTDGEKALAGARLAARTLGAFAFAAAREAVSDDKGDATLGAGAGDLIEVTLDGWDPLTHVVRREEVLHRDVEITLVRSTGDRAVVRGAVVDEQSQPIDGAQVTLLEGDAVVGAALTGVDGAFEVPTTLTPTLRARATHAGLVPDEQPVSNARMTLRLRRGCIVPGRVKDKSGPSVASATIVVRRVSGQGPTPPSPTSYDADGHFEVRGVPSGRYSMQALASGFAPSATRVVEVTDACDTPEVVFELGHGGTVYGRVTDGKSRDPIVATVTLEGAWEGAGMDVRSTATTDASGTFEIGGVPAGRRSIIATAEGHHSRIVAGLDVRDGERSGPVDVALDEVQPGETQRTQLTGIGAVLSVGDGVLVIMNAMPGSGAEAAGLVKGDEIVAVDGNEIRSMGFEEATNAIRGPEGTTVSLEVKKAKGQLVTLVVQRKVVR